MSGAYSNLALQKEQITNMYVSHGMTATTRKEPPTKRVYKLNVDQDHINCNVLTRYNTIQGGCGVRYYLERYMGAHIIIMIITSRLRRASALWSKSFVRKKVWREFSSNAV